MLRTAILALSLVSLAALPASANAAPCRDAKGKFAKCPEVAKKVDRCRNSKGQFAKCGTPGAKPSK